MIGDWVKLARLSNALVAGFGVWLGHACLPQQMDWTAASIGFIALALLVMAGNIHNDILDLSTDSINRPTRPLPQGRVTGKQAWWATVALYFTSLALAFTLGRAAGILTLGMAALLYIYNLKLKSLPLFGNLAVSLLCALAIYFPESPGLPIHTGLPALFAFLTTLAREIAKDAEDILGDTAVGRITFPIRFGTLSTRLASMLVTTLILALLPIPYLWLNYHAGYGLVALIGPLPLLVIVLKKLFTHVPDWGGIQRNLKWVMLAGMLAIFAGILF